MNNLQSRIYSVQVDKLNKKEQIDLIKDFQNDMKITSTHFDYLRSISKVTNE